MDSAPQFSPMRMQVVAHLRRELASGRWGGMMPGSHRLARELGVNRKTTEAALAELERLGVVENQGVGRRRRILAPPGDLRPHRLRIAILDYEPLVLTEAYAVELQHLLLAAGHRPFFKGFDESCGIGGMILVQPRRIG